MKLRKSKMPRRSLKWTAAASSSLSSSPTWVNPKFCLNYIGNCMYWWGQSRANGKPRLLSPPPPSLALTFQRVSGTTTTRRRVRKSASRKSPGLLAVKQRSTWWWWWLSGVWIYETLMNFDYIFPLYYYWCLLVSLALEGVIGMEARSILKMGDISMTRKWKQATKRMFSFYHTPKDWITQGIYLQLPTVNPMVSIQALCPL